MPPSDGRRTEREAPPEKPGGRIRSIDLLRGLAIVPMIAAHASDAFLAEIHKQHTPWHLLNLVFGFVAPAFLVLSGVTLRLAVERCAARDSTTGIGGLALRAATVLLLGYWLQIPVLSFRQLIWNQRPDELARLFDSNILQVIGLGALLILVVVASVRSIERAGWVTILIALAIVVATPWIWREGLNLIMPLPLRSFVAPQPIATFPLFPFVAYLLFGFATGKMIAEAARSRAALLLLMLLTATFLLCSFLLDATIGTIPPHDDYWGSSIQHVLVRLSGVLALTTLGSFLARFLPAHRTAIETAGARSLPIYLLHLMLIYGSPVTMGMRYWFDGVLTRTLGPWETAALFVAVVVAVYAAVRLWDRFREQRPSEARLIAWEAWGAFLAVFLTKP